ncbi:hypothetical protein CEE69_00965 [Rhodopirellula bahusiensis]|uniref:Uncharacterized protein n=1 Tax=Rhodopirellula bahusiensis TaxID=2014065 RepID=A0A2G1WEB1_9BACT|nr:hypothetical protein CEE69_00965 [Rhodopirellula bahusiensis]
MGEGGSPDRERGRESLVAKVTVEVFRKTKSAETEREPIYQIAHRAIRCFPDFFDMKGGNCEVGFVGSDEW